MERQKHSITTLVDSLLKYSIDYSIFVKKFDDPFVYELVFYVRYDNLNIVFNILKSTLGVYKSVVGFGSDSVSFAVYYDHSNLPF